MVSLLTDSVSVLLYLAESIIKLYNYSMGTSAFRAVVLLTIATAIFAASTPAIWQGSAIFNSQSFSVITSPATKSGTGTVTFPAAYATPPKLFVGIFKLSSQPGDTVLGFELTVPSRLATGITFNIVVNALTTISVMKVNALTCANDSTTSFLSVNYAGPSGFSNLSTGSGPRYQITKVNFTAISGISMDPSHTIKMTMFINAITMQCNSGNFTFTVLGTFVDANNYVLNSSTDGNTTVTSLRFSRFIYDITALQASGQTFIDSNLITATATTWSQLSLTLVWKTASNFFIGMRALAYQPSSSADFDYDEVGLTCSGVGTFNMLSFGYWNYRHRTCPPGYPFFAVTTNLCYDVCDPYYYPDTISVLCYPCSYQCYTCSNTTVPTNCTSCDSAVAHRVLNGTTCQCDVSYYDSGVTNCAICDYTCAACTDGTRCSTCSAADFRALGSGQCPCITGYVDTGVATCAHCSTFLVGCTACSSTTVCDSCDIALSFVLVGSICTCDSGYYPSGTSCLSCAIMPGCLTCTDSANCLTCDTTALFQPNGPLCQCVTGYYLASGVCTPCPVGCTACDSTGATCSSCDSANGFLLVSQQCVCSSGTYLPSGGAVCLPCASLYDMCLVCTTASCTSCAYPAVVSGSACVCSSGYYNDTVSCALCSGQFLGCGTCTLGTCLGCDPSIFFSPAPVANQCLCQPGYTMMTPTCIKCSTLLTGCVNCSSSSVCTSCDAANFFSVVGGHCLCQPTYFFNATSQCQACNSTINGCYDCTNGSVCVNCDAASHFAPLPLADGTCGCAPTYVLSGTACVTCMVSCVCNGYKWDAAGNCLPVCSDGITISPTEECDDGNLVNGDGCSSACGIERNFTCTLDASLLSSCSYSQPLSLTFLETFKSPSTNQLTFKVKIGPVLSALAALNLSQLFTPNSSSLSNPAFVYDSVNGTVSLTYDYNQNLQNENISLTLNPGVEVAFAATPLSVIAFPVLPRNNLPALVYDNDTYEEFQRMDTVYKAAVYTSYGLLALGMLCDKVIGVELFGVLQLAHLATSNLDSVQPLLSPLMNMSIVHGYNVDSNRSVGLLPNRVRQIQYGQLFLNNFNVMMGAMLLEAVVASVLWILGTLVPKLRKQKLAAVGVRMLKEYLLTLIVFNSYNISYSLGIQLAYPDAQNHLFSFSNLVAIASLLFPVAIVGAILLTDNKEFGEFCSHFKSDPVCKGYFVLTLLYRVVLGQSMGRLNESEDATVVHVFYAIIFLLYMLANRPYVKAHHNYRAVVVQASGLIILSVTMYYRSMRSTTAPSVTYQILSPALVEVVAVFASIAISAACVFYELYLKITQWTKAQPLKQKVWPLGYKRETTETDIIDNPHIPIP